MDTKKVKWFLIFTFTSSYILQIIAGENEARGLGPLIMFTPLISCFLVGADVNEMGWIPKIEGNIKPILIAWLSPVVLDIAGAVLFFVVFPDSFDGTAESWAINYPEEYQMIIEEYGSFGSYVLEQIIKMIMGAFIGMITAIGEEAGWRGFLYPQLKKGFGKIKALIIGGIIWSFFHFVIIVFYGFNYGLEYIGAPVMGMLVFAVFCIADGIIADYVYEKTECIWIPALFHGAINSTGIGILFDNECHPERSIFGPCIVGMISMLPTVAFAVYLLYKEKYYEREY